MSYMQLTEDFLDLGNPINESFFNSPDFYCFENIKLYIDKEFEEFNDIINLEEGLNIEKIKNIFKRAIDFIIKSITKFVDFIVNKIKSIFKEKEIEATEKYVDKVVEDRRLKTEEEIREYFNTPEKQEEVRQLQERILKWSEKRFGKTKEIKEATDFTKLNSTGSIDGKSHLTFIDISCDDKTESLCNEISHIISGYVLDLDVSNDEFDSVIEKLSSASFKERISFSKVRITDQINSSMFKSYFKNIKDLSKTANSNMIKIKNSLKDLKNLSELNSFEDDNVKLTEIESRLAKLNKILTNFQKEYSLYIEDLKDALVTSRSNLRILDINR